MCIFIHISHRADPVAMTVKPTTTIKELYMKTADRFCIDYKYTDLYCGSKVLCHTSQHETLEEDDIHINSHIIVTQRLVGGGDFAHLISHVSGCSGECLFLNNFHELRNMYATQNIVKEKKDAYKILYKKYNFSDEDIRAIKDNSESICVRLYDVLHRLVHRDPCITWKKVNEKIFHSN